MGQNIIKSLFCLAQRAIIKYFQYFYIKGRMILLDYKNFSQIFMLTKKYQNIVKREIFLVNKAIQLA